MIDKDIFKLSIVIPCYNEKNTIENILKKINKSLKDYKISKYEIIIVDDYSNDGTNKLLKNLAFDEKIQIHYHDNKFVLFHQMLSFLIVYLFHHLSNHQQL